MSAIESSAYNAAQHAATPVVTERPRVATAWTLAGGIAGGALVSFLVFTARMHPDFALVATAVLALAGSMFGFVHGGILGVLGHPHPPAASPPTLLQRLLPAALIVAATALALMVALFLTMGTVLALSGNPAGWVTLAVAGSFAAATFVRATILGWRAFENSYQRWPDHRIGTLLVVGSFLILATSFLSLGPALPGADSRISSLLALLLAALATLWVATPAIIMMLRFGHRARRDRHSDVQRTR